MIADLFTGTPVATHETRGDIAVTLHPAEAAAIAAAVPARRREFGTVRSCARTAASKLGISLGPLIPGFDRAPQWPAGVTGSLTHCADYRAAAVACDHTIRSVGIDAELLAPLPDRAIEDIVLTPHDHRYSHQDDHPDLAEWATVVFSAKEALFKTWWPLTGQWLDFSQVDIDLHTDTFTAHIRSHPAALSRFGASTACGRWAVGDGLILTAVTTTRAQTPIEQTPRRKGSHQGPE